MDYAEEIISNGFTSKYIATELNIIAKYYKSLGKNEDEIKQVLIDFCKSNLKGFNQAIHFKIINTAVKHSLNPKNKLIQIDKVDIIKNELSIIEAMDIPHDYKRVVFTLLALTKLNKDFGKIKNGEIKSSDFNFGGHKNYRELVATSKITFNKTKKSIVKNIHDLIRVLDEKGIVEITGNGKIKLLFMYGIEEDDDIVFSVNDYSVIGFFYDLYCGENRVKECESCRIPIKAKSNRQNFCEACSRDKKLEKYKKYNKKRS